MSHELYAGLVASSTDLCGISFRHFILHVFTHFFAALCQSATWNDRSSIILIYVDHVQMYVYYCLMLTVALWLNLLSSHLITARPLNGMKGLLIYMRLQKAMQTKLLMDIILDVLVRDWSIDQKYTRSISSPRGVFRNFSKELFVLKLLFSCMCCNS